MNGPVRWRDICVIHTQWHLGWSLCCSRYTYGKPVPGLVTISVCRKYTLFPSVCHGQNSQRICEEFSKRVCRRHSLVLTFSWAAVLSVTRQGVHGKCHQARLWSRGKKYKNGWPCWDEDKCMSLWLPIAFGQFCNFLANSNWHAMFKNDKDVSKTGFCHRRMGSGVEDWANEDPVAHHFQTTKGKILNSKWISGPEEEDLEDSN